MHTPSTPEVKQPASATDPRYSTSGILNAQIKEKNRQGLLSTFGGRTGRDVNINKFADAKNYARDPSAVPMLEKLARLYSDAAAKSQAQGVGNSNTKHHSTSARNIGAYNESADAVNNYLKSYGVESGKLTKASDSHNYDKRSFHSDNFGAGNAGDVNASVAKAGQTGEAFNELEKQVKKQKQPTKQ